MLNRWRFLGFGGLGLAIALGSGQAIAQIPVCQPPQTNEFLVFVDTQTPENQAQLQRTLPAIARVTQCQYLGNVVSRISGFASLEDAQNWGRYAIDIGGMPAFVIKPGQTNLTSVSLGYNPQPLGAGFAVLVDYFNRPELAAQVQQVLGKKIGLVSFSQRPFLLAVYTQNQQEARNTLQQLSDRGFSAMIVDARQAVLLSSQVSD